MTTRSRHNELDVSVVIPSYNSRDTIADCIRALQEQQSRSPLEIIVVDSSSDGTGDMISREFPEVDLVRLERRTHAGIGRNIGARRSKGAIVAFTDADCVPAPDWLSNVVRNQQARESDAPRVVAGSIQNGTPRSLVGTAEWLIEFSNAFPGLPPCQVPFAATANLSLPREVFDATEGFDNSKTGQDMVFGETLRRFGHTIHFDPNTRVAHQNRVELRRFLSRQFALGRGSALIRRRLPLHGHWIVRLPFLVPALIPYRLLRVIQRALKANRNYLPALLKTAPLIVCGLTAWSAGFLAGAITRRPADSRPQPPETFKTEDAPIR